MSSHDTETNTAGTLTPASKRVKLENAVAPEDAVIEESSTELNVEGCVVATALETHEMAPEIFIKLTVSWQGRSFAVELCESDRVADLKDKLNSLTSVPPDRQKIIGLISRKLPPDDVTIRKLGLTPGKKFTLIGTPVGMELQARSDDTPDVMNDFDVDVSQYPELMMSFANDQRNVRKVKEATDNLELHIMNEPREGKPLLVLDLDYTLLDTKPMTRGALPVMECARPGLHQFLEKAYRDYDICIWSQTSWVWVETKLVELEMVGTDRPYKISFVLDQRPMFRVFTKKDGKSYTHPVKPLKVIWNKFPQWDTHNTIHIDDLSRNFALNPLNGIKIEPFRHAHTPEAQGDRQLALLSLYLGQLAKLKVDFSKPNHRHWHELAKHLHKGSRIRWSESKSQFQLVPDPSNMPSSRHDSASGVPSSPSIPIDVGAETTTSSVALPSSSSRLPIERLVSSPLASWPSSIPVTSAASGGRGGIRLVVIPSRKEESTVLTTSSTSNTTSDDCMSQELPPPPLSVPLSLSSNGPPVGGSLITTLQSSPSSPSSPVNAATTADATSTSSPSSDPRPNLTKPPE